MRRFNRVMTAALCSAMLVPAAYAQEAPQAEEDSGDEPIIVTATLRAIDVQDIPLGVKGMAQRAPGGESGRERRLGSARHDSESGRARATFER